MNDTPASGPVDEDEISLLDLLQVVADHLRLLVLGPLAAGLAALGITAASAAGVAPTYLGHRGPRSKLNRWRSGAGR